MKLENVLYVPDIQGNFISIRELLKNDYAVVFDKSVCEISKNKKQIGLAKLSSELFIIIEEDDVIEMKNSKIQQKETKSKGNKIHINKEKPKVLKFYQNIDAKYHVNQSSKYENMSMLNQEKLSWSRRKQKHSQLSY